MDVRIVGIASTVRVVSMTTLVSAALVLAVAPSHAVVSCEGGAASAPILDPAGTSAPLGDFTLECSGGLPTDPVLTVDVQLFTNAPLIQTATPTLSIEGTEYPGSVTGSNSIVFSGVSINPVASSVAIQQVLVNPSQQAEGFLYVAFLTVVSAASLPINDPQQILATNGNIPADPTAFADRVRSNDIDINGLGQPTLPHRTARHALGAPDYAGGVCVANTCTYVSLGVGGSITLAFVDNRLTGSDSPALDLQVFEVGPQAEDVFVEISKDGISYVPVGKVVLGATSGIDIDAFGFGRADQFRFVRLIDDPAQGGVIGPMVGADIDAVRALSSAPPLDYTMSGHVRDLYGSPVAGVSVSLTGTATAMQTTDADGLYEFVELAGGTYTVTPMLPSFAFDPVSQIVSNLAADTEVAPFIVTSGAFTRYFAEGATGTFFTTEIALLNATGTPADTTVSFQTPDGTSVDVPVSLSGYDHRTLNPATVPGLENTALATVIQSTQPIIADRTMRWDAQGYGSHTETSLATPSTQWYLAEGATTEFDVFYLIQNPGSTAAEVEVTYLRPSPDPPLVKTYVVAANSRFDIWINVEQFDTGGLPQPLLADAEFSAAIAADHPVIVERAMYLSRGGRQFDAGHESAASPTLSTTWFLAEGATGPFFDLFVLMANPNDEDALVEVTYLLPGSTFTKSYTVPGRSRFSIWADTDDPRLADTAVSMAVTSINDVSIVVERTMWWPGDFATWIEGHNSRGATASGEKWAMADGDVGGALGTDTYVLIANTSTFDASVEVTLVFADGTTDAQVYTVPASSRFNVPVGSFFPGAADRRFGVVVESLPVTDGVARIVVERASYNDATLDGQLVVWAAGANAFATKLR